MPLPVFRLESPYTRFEPVADLASLDPAWLMAGTILALGIGQLEREAAASSKQELEGAAASMPDSAEVERQAAALVEWIPVLRSRYLAHPLVLRVRGLGDRAALELGRLAAELHIRGVLVDGDHAAATVRNQFTDPEHLRPDFLAWLAYGPGNVSRFSRLVIEQIFLDARRHQPLQGIVQSLGIGSISDVRNQLRDEGLPEPRKWRRLAEALYAVLHLQRHSGSLFAHAIRARVQRWGVPQPPGRQGIRRASRHDQEDDRLAVVGAFVVTPADDQRSVPGGALIAWPAMRRFDHCGLWLREPFSARL